MDRERGQHDVQAIERIRAIAPKEKISGDSPIFYQRFHSCPSDAPLTACEQPLSRNRSLLGARVDDRACGALAFRVRAELGQRHRHEDITSSRPIFPNRVLSKN